MAKQKDRISVHQNGKQLGNECPFLDKSNTTRRLHEWLEAQGCGSHLYAGSEWTLIDDGRVCLVRDSRNRHNNEHLSAAPAFSEKTIFQPPEKIVLLLPYMGKTIDQQRNGYCFESEVSGFRERLVLESEERHKLLVRELTAPPTQNKLYRGELSCQMILTNS